MFLFGEGFWCGTENCVQLLKDVPTTHPRESLSFLCAQLFPTGIHEQSVLRLALIFWKIQYS